MLENTMIFIDGDASSDPDSRFCMVYAWKSGQQRLRFPQDLVSLRYAALKPEIRRIWIMALESFGKNRRREEDSRYPVVDVRQNRLQMKEWKLKGDEREEHFSTGQKKNFV